VAASVLLEASVVDCSVVLALLAVSAGYQGGGPSAVPSGYIEAYAQAGRNIGQGVQAIGNAIGESLARYGQNKAESEFVQARYEQLRPYIDTVARTGNVMDERSPESKLLADVGKFSTMSLPQKKAALMNAEFYLDRADKAKARELQDLQTQQIKNQITTQQQLGELMRYGMTMPTEVSVSDQITETVQPVGPVQPAMQPQAAPTFNEQGYLQALRQYQQQTAPAVNAADIQAQLAQLQPLVSETPRQFRIPSLQGGMGGGLAVGQATVTETPQQVAGRIAQNLPRVQQLQAQLQAAQAKPATMPRREDFITQPAAQQPAAQFLPPVEVTTPVTRTEQVPYEQLRKNMAQFAAQQGMNPEVFASLDKVLEVAGQRKPTQVEQVGNIGSVVRFGDKEQFVPAKEANIGDMLKVRGLTIDFPEFRGTAPTEAEASKFREQYSNVLDSRKTIAELLDIAKMGTAMQQTPEVRARANSLASGLRGIERINIIGPGTITPEDFKLLNSVIPDPTSIFSLKKSNIQAFETMLQKSARAIESRAKSIGLEVLKPDQQQPAATRSGFVRYNPLTKKLE
jgi:hypothetical protein